LLATAAIGLIDQSDVGAFLIALGTFVTLTAAFGLFGGNALLMPRLVAGVALSLVYQIQIRAFVRPPGTFVTFNTRFRPFSQ
jgi:hypothetical protein